MRLRRLSFHVGFFTLIVLLIPYYWHFSRYSIWPSFQLFSCYAMPESYFSTYSVGKNNFDKSWWNDICHVYAGDWCHQASFLASLNGGFPRLAHVEKCAADSMVCARVWFNVLGKRMIPERPNNYSLDQLLPSLGSLIKERRNPAFWSLTLSLGPVMSNTADGTGNGIIELNTQEIFQKYVDVFTSERSQADHIS